LQHNSKIKKLIKRLIDIFISTAILLSLSPLLIIISAIVAIIMGRPVLFTQMRPGLKGLPFNIIKFRSMSDKRDKHGELLPDGERLNRFGKFLRSTSIDELPALLNVLKGDMSLVGPRPLLMEYLSLYSTEQARRHNVRPGITGWAQVNGRNSLSWEEKFILDNWYVDNQSTFLDFHILWLTISKVIRREGVSHKGEVTMQAFTGNKS
jgi:sugar transferase EpsL